MNGEREEIVHLSSVNNNNNNSNRLIPRRDSANVHVSVECPMEPRIAEITYDGREIVQPPISKEEKLYRNANKINFANESAASAAGAQDELASVGVESTREKDARTRRGRPDASSIVSSLSNVREKLRDAFVEMSVLHDVLSLSRERKYLRFEASANDPIECRPHFNMATKKKAALGAANILTTAVDRLKLSTTAAQKVENDYHSSLNKLRDQWRLKKVGVHVSGDLGYRTVGSSLKGAGQFELRKNEESDQKPLEVIIAGDLDGETCIQIDIESSTFPDSAKDYERDLRTKDLWSRIISVDNPLHRQLTSAQNALYCRELMMLLSAEAVNLPLQCLSPVVLGDEIHYTSFLGYSVRIKLVHVPANSTALGSGGVADSTSSRPFTANSTLPESRVIELALSYTLLSRMRDFSDPDLPIAACGPVGLKSFRRKMAIQARDRRIWKQPLAGRTLTSQLLDMAQGLLLKKRLTKIADELSSPDLLIVVHDGSSLTSWKDCLVKISLTIPGHDIYNRTNCAFHVFHGEAFFLTRDYVLPISISDDLDCHLLYVEIVRQHAAMLQSTLKAHRFEVTQYVPSYDFFCKSPRPPSGSLSKAMTYGITVIARSLDERWVVKVVCSLRYVYRFYVARRLRPQTRTSAVRNKTFLPTEYTFHEVDLSKVIAGDTRIRRINLILGYLASLPGESNFLVLAESSSVEQKRENPKWTKWETVE